MMNRHGLVAGATGTGKTRTLQGLAEQLSAAGVSVFVADMKGDLSGLSTPGAADGPAPKRDAELGEQYTPTGFPVEYLALGGIGSGVPVRATVSDFGPQLLAKVLDANETQEQSLGLVFRYADEKQLPLLDLADLRALLTFLASDEGKQELTGIGGVSSQTIGVLLRTLVGLEDGGGTELFGEPRFDVADLLRTAPDGRGIISCLELPGVQDKPKLFSTALMWVLAELFEHLPEVGDLEKPKLVFFFDEAHLLFDGASKAFLESIEQTVRLIRSKGVGVFFVTQTPKDVPGDVLAQLGNRVSTRCALSRRRRESAQGDRLDVPPNRSSTTWRACSRNSGSAKQRSRSLRNGGPDARSAYEAARAVGPDGTGGRRRRRREGFAALREVRNPRRQPKRARDSRGSDRARAEAGGTGAGGGAQEGSGCDGGRRRRARRLPAVEAGEAAAEGSHSRRLRPAEEADVGAARLQGEREGYRSPE